MGKSDSVKTARINARGAIIAALITAVISGIAAVAVHFLSRSDPPTVSIQQKNPDGNNIQQNNSGGNNSGGNIAQQNNSGGTNTQQTTNGAHSPITNIYNPPPRVPLDHRGNLQVKGTPTFSRDSSGFDIIAHIQMWNAGDYEIQPNAMVITCLLTASDIGRVNEQDFANQSLTQMLHSGRCRAWSQVMNAIERQADYPETIITKRDMGLAEFLSPQNVTDALANGTLNVCLYVQAYYRDSMSGGNGFDLHTKYCSYFGGPGFRAGPCPFAGDGIFKVTWPQKPSPSIPLNR